MGAEPGREGFEKGPNLGMRIGSACTLTCASPGTGVALARARLAESIRNPSAGSCAVVVSAIRFHGGTKTGSKFGSPASDRRRHPSPISSSCAARSRVTPTSEGRAPAGSWLTWAKPCCSSQVSRARTSRSPNSGTPLTGITERCIGTPCASASASNRSSSGPGASASSSRHQKSATIPASAQRLSSSSSSVHVAMTAKLTDINGLCNPCRRQKKTPAACAPGANSVDGSLRLSLTSPRGRRRGS